MASHIRRHAAAPLAALALIAAVSFPDGPANACRVIGYRNGEPVCYTNSARSHNPRPVEKAKSWTNPDDWSKPAEKCRAACLRDAMKWSRPEAQTAWFNQCSASC
jgi:hypothetical protein